MTIIIRIFYNYITFEIGNSVVTLYMLVRVEQLNICTNIGIKTIHNFFSHVRIKH